ncbi:MAG: hypothetical protein ACI9K5_001276, partial [Gammaproteobacteria bacterium]
MSQRIRPLVLATLSRFGLVAASPVFAVSIVLAALQTTVAALPAQLTQSEAPQVDASSNKGGSRRFFLRVVNGTGRDIRFEVRDAHYFQGEQGKFLIGPDQQKEVSLAADTSDQNRVRWFYVVLLDERFRGEYLKVGMRALDGNLTDILVYPNTGLYHLRYDIGPWTERVTVDSPWLKWPYRDVGREGSQEDLW